MSTNLNGAVLRVVPANVSPAPVPAPNTPGASHGLNTLRAVSDYGPSEMAELDTEIAELLEKVDKLQFQRHYLSRLLGVATEYYEIARAATDETRGQRCAAMRAARRSLTTHSNGGLL